MSLLPSTSSSCRSIPRHASQLGKTFANQTRGAAQKAPPVKKAQSIGGLKKGRDERRTAMIARERTHASRDIPMFTKMPDEKLKTPKSGDRPAFLHPLFEPGAAHALKLPAFEGKSATQANVSTIQSFNLTPDNPAKVFGLPKKMFLEFRALSSPASVLRPVTLDALAKVDAAYEVGDVDRRYVITGRAGSGKSFVLHQAVQYAKEKGYIVIYIPRAASLVNSTTPHVYDLRTQTYLQPMAAYQLLEKILKVNEAALEQLKLEEEIVLSTPIPSATSPTQKRASFSPQEGLSLAEVMRVALKDKSAGSASVVLEGIMKVLEGQERFPTLLAVDSLQSLFHPSAYKDPFFSAIKPWHLGVPRMVLEWVSGRRGGKRTLLLTAITASDTTYTVPLEIRDALDLGYAHPVSEYEKRDTTLAGYLEGVDKKGLKKIEVPDRLTIEEAAALFGLWKDDLALGTRTYDETFLSKYVESDGNPRDFVWKGILSSIAP